ncbi:MAG: GNAT family N-acetyltransferase [Acholeplasmataceae bacterium]|nr:GNAT family N-acetyltransferase [Acholeplasmataceae bacterium]
MLSIRILNKDELKEAVMLKITCWSEELNGVAENQINFDEEYKFFIDWMDGAQDANDIRTLIGIFEDGSMLGCAFASFADIYDCEENGIELNGLWIYPSARNRKLSLMLLEYILSIYMPLGMEKMIVYSHHYAPSNMFYHHLGGQIIKYDLQMHGKLEVDIFEFNLEELNHFIQKKLNEETAEQEIS